MAGYASEKTVLLVKPDGVKRGLIGEILARIERTGLRIVALRMVNVSKEEANDHYPKEEGWIAGLGEKTKATYEKYGEDLKADFGTDDTLEIGKNVRSWLIDFFTAGPVVKAVIEGPHARDMVRKLVGNTIPAFADIGTIRGDYSVDSPAFANKEKRPIFNLVHASDTEDEAANELNLWFDPEEIFDYHRAEDLSRDEIMKNS